jgi:hypothetical protein
MNKIDDSEYAEAWNELEKKEQPAQPKPKAESGFMEKLSVVKDALLSSSKPRTNTMGGVR